MRMVDIIAKKRNNEKLTQQEIAYVIKGYSSDEIPDYQMSALLMAICFQGLDAEETAVLTKEMLHSGDVIDLSMIDGIKVDKHSTGGVGDKVSLVLGPMVSAAGAKVAKMSGRGLGHTGGTLDKLEAIPGFQIEIDQESFIKQVQEIGLAIIGQSPNLVPADKKMYALRDVTSTVDCIPLIAASIMSKKLASGSDAILLDVKYGDGAFMKDQESAKHLAKTMIEIGKSFNKSTCATISNMTQPLGMAIGNSLEVIEAIDTLKGNGPDDLLELCMIAGSQMLLQAGIVTNLNEARVLLQEGIDSGLALQKLREMVEYQSGDATYIDDTNKFPSTKLAVPVIANKDGYIKSVIADKLGVVSMKLGGGRLTKADTIDHSVGVILKNKIGDVVVKGQTLCILHANSEVEKELLQETLDAFIIVDDIVRKPVLIDEIVE